MAFFKSIVAILLTSSLFIACEEEQTAAPTNPRILNLQATGDAANELLSADEYRSITLELVSVKGFEPTSEAVDNFVDFIEERTFKPGGVRLLQRSIDSPNEENLTIEEVDELEKKNRTVYSDATNHAIYVYFADAENIKTAESRNNQGNERQIILGTAYRNTSMVIYEKTLRDITRLRPNSLPNTETSILNHEFGHLLGLVNLGTPMVVPHEAESEDEEKHCNVEGCLMQANFQSAMLNSDTILQLDPLCIQDLRANGGR